MSIGMIRFSYNWNNKLDGKYFTTIRRYNPDKYYNGAEYEVHLRTSNNWRSCFGTVVAIDVKCLTLKQIRENEWLCGMDTGYSAEETEGILRKMYKDCTDETLFSYVLLKRIKK